MSLKTETTESHMKQWEKIFFACVFAFVFATGCHTNLKTAKGPGKMDLDNIKHGIVFFTFDDRNFNGWLQAIPLFEKYNAHATFMVSGEIDQDTAQKIKMLQEHGHSIGLHTKTHSDMPPFCREKSAEEYFSAEIAPQLEASKKYGLEIRNFAYPNNARTDETDAFLLKYFRKLRAGCGRTNGLDLTQHAPLFRSIDSLKTDHLMRGAGIGTYYNSSEEMLCRVLKRAAAENLAVVFFSHNIAPAAQHIHMPTGTLENCLKLAQELGIKVAGFDEIP